MNIWLSVPSLAIPMADYEPGNNESQYESRVLITFSKSTEIAKDNCTMLSDINLGGSKYLMVLVTKKLMTDCDEDWKPDVYVDCNKSSIAGSLITNDTISTGSYTSSSLPEMSIVERGMDVVSTFLLLQRKEPWMKRGAILFAIEEGMTIGNGVQKREFPIAEATFAIAVSISPLAFPKSFPVLHVATSHNSNDWGNNIEAVLDDITRNTGISPNEITWSIAHRHSTSLLDALRQALPQTSWLVRDFRPFNNFGCVDPFVSIQSIFIAGSRPSIGIGVIWFAGEQGSVGAMVINSQSLGLWNRYISEKPPYTQ